MKRIFMVLAFFAGISTYAGPLGDGFALDPRLIGDSPDDELQWAQANGVRHFNILVELCQDNLRSNDVRWCRDKDSASMFREIKKIALRAKEFGMTIGFFPMLLPVDGDWRGFAEPENFKTWGNSYLERMQELALLAEQIGVAEFMVGTELNRIFIASDPNKQAERNAFWTRALKIFKKRLGVPTFIVANWDQYDQIPFWNSSDYIGLSAYYPLTNSVDAESSIPTLTVSWKVWAKRLKSVAVREGKPLYFSEVGYASRTTAAHTPWHYSEPATVDLDLQARLFSAFANVWAYDPEYSSILVRVLVWGFYKPEQPELDFGFSPLDKPAEGPVSKMFKARAP
jgi:hypothetical protein